jgi:hypothetical protein
MDVFAAAVGVMDVVSLRRKMQAVLADLQGLDSLLKPL